MIDLIFDTETSGFPLWREPPSHPGQAHLVQLAYIQAKGDEILNTHETIVYCPVEIHEKAAEVHGISTTRSRTEGKKLDDVVQDFICRVQESDRIICHNTGFDMLIMQIAYHRIGANPDRLTSLPRVCTMRSATPIVKAPHKNRRSGYKWPNLQETYRHFIDPKGFKDAHDAMVDTKACFKILRALEAKGVELVCD